MRADSFAVLQQTLRARGMTYADLADKMGVSEPTIKRLFAAKDCKLSRLIEICEILQIQLSDVIDRAARVQDTITHLPRRTEAALAADPSLMHFFVLLRDNVPQAHIARRFELSEADMFRLGRKLETLELAEVMETGRIRLTAERPMRFRRDGPLMSVVQRINERFVAQMLMAPQDERTKFVALTRRMLPDTAARVAVEVQALHTLVTGLARQDQLLAPAEDLIAFKLTAAWGVVDYTEILEVRPPKP